MSEAIDTEEIKQGLNETMHTRFRHGRLEAGYSLRVVAEAAGVSIQAISNFESGHAIQLAVFVAACELLHLNVRWVLKGVGRMWEGNRPVKIKKWRRLPQPTDATS